MTETSISLLDRVRLDSDTESWQRLAAIYEPVLHAWLRRYELQMPDADDLVQEVLLVVCREVSRFEHSGRPGAFRSWLRTILVNRLRDFWRSRGRRPNAAGGSGFLEELDQLEDPNSALSRVWDRQHDEYVMRQALEHSKSKFTTNTWHAFQRVALDGLKATDVAAELGISVNAVLIAKSRVLGHLKRETRDLID